MDLNNQQLRYLTDRELCDAIKALDEPIVGELLENCYEDLKIKVAKNIYLVALEGEQEGNYIPYSASDDWSYLKDLLSDKDFTFRIYPLYRNEQFNDYPRYTLKTVDSIRIYDFDGDNQHRDTELENLFHQLNFSTEKPPIKTPPIKFVPRFQSFQTFHVHNDCGRPSILQICPTCGCHHGYRQTCPTCRCHLYGSLRDYLGI